MSEFAKSAHVKWDHSISLGHIITILTLIFGIGSFLFSTGSTFSRIDSRVTALETDNSAIRRSLEVETSAMRSALSQMDQRNREADAEIRVAIRRVDDKLSAILIQRFDRNTPEPPR